MKGYRTSWTVGASQSLGATVDCRMTHWERFTWWLSRRVRP